MYIRIADVNVNTDNLFYKCFDFKTKMLSHFLFVDFELNKPFLNISEDKKNLYIYSVNCEKNGYKHIGTTCIHFSSTNEAIDDFIEKVMNQVDGKLLHLDESNFN